LKDNSLDKNSIKWSKFAGLASQWAVALVFFLFLGKYLDSLHYIKLKFPLFIWLLPFIFIVFSLFRIIKDTGRKAKNDLNE
jgi:hypothetical protein